MSGFLLICDMDGTLLDKGCNISKENLQAIERFVDGGGLFTVATGRMEFAVRRYIEILPVNVPAILYNGAAIFDFKTWEVLWTQNLDDGTEESLNEICAEYPEIGVEVFNKGDIYLPQSNEEIIAHMKKEGFTPKAIPSKGIPKPWYKVLLAWEHERLLGVDEFLKSRNYGFRTVFSEPQFLELLHNNASKGNALKELLRITGMTDRYVIAMGDNMNDKEMLETAHVGVAVENANPALKVSADMCCCSHEDHAAAHIINLIENGKIRALEQIT